MAGIAQNGENTLFSLWSLYQDSKILKRDGKYRKMYSKYKKYIYKLK